MENNRNDKTKNLRIVIFFCALCAGVLGIVGMYHLLAFDRPWDYFSAAGSIGLMCALIGVYRKLK